MAYQPNNTPQTKLQQHYPLHPSSGNQASNGYQPSKPMLPSNSAPNQPGSNFARPPSNFNPPPLTKPPLSTHNPTMPRTVNELQHGTPSNNPLLQGQYGNQTTSQGHHMNGITTNTTNLARSLPTPLANGFDTQTHPGMQKTSQRSTYPTQVPRTLLTSQNSNETVTQSNNQSYTPSQPRMQIPTMPGNQMNRPTLPGNQMNRPTLPGNEMNRPTMPGNQLNHPTLPGNEMNRPTMPGNQMNRPTLPGNQMNRPTLPGNQINRPTMPGNQMNRPTLPGNQMNRPTLPGNQMNRPTMPGNQMNRPTLPGNQMNRPTMPMNNTQTNTPNRHISNYPQMPQGKEDGQDPNLLMKRLTVEQSQTYGVNLIEQKQIISPQPIPPPNPPMSQELQRKNAKPQTMRCTFNAIPQTSNLLKQSKLPFGVYIQPFIEDPNIPVVSSVITRCRSCRSYINPFVTIIDHRRWQCNICYRINDIPEELTYDYSNRQYQDVHKRPELNYGTIEFIAPTEYMLRPPQPSVFIFVLDVSYNALGTGYLKNTCEIISANLNKLPGDARTMVGFITFNSSVHFYSLKITQNQPEMFMVSDIEDIFLPVPDGLLVNVKENKDMILQLLESLPTSFGHQMDTKAATGAAMLAAKKMASSTGGRITVFQTCLPNVGPGKLSLRESSNISASSKDVVNLNPSTDFYKKLALECAGEQIAIDLFILAGQYCDLGSMSGVSRYSSGSIHYFPDYHHSQSISIVEKFTHDFKRYLTRNIGFEAVMRLRCTKGMNINTFHGNFFVRSTDLLSLPNVNPDHSFSMQIDIEDDLTDSSMVGFQAALLYTTTKGERRIRVHTMSLPVTSKLSDVYAYADQETIITSLSKLASDRTLMSSLGDAREALMNACIDCLKTYRHDVINQRQNQAIIAPYQLRLLPLHISAMMKNEAFKLGGSVSLDQRVFSLLEFKWLTHADAMLRFYPRVYPLLDLVEEHEDGYNGPPILGASAERLSRQGIYLMDNGRSFYIFVGRNVSDGIIQGLFNMRSYNELPEKMNRLPELDTDINKKTREFVQKLRKQRTFYPPLQIIREDQKYRMLFLNNLIDDRTESSMSYHEFLQHVQRQMNGR